MTPANASALHDLRELDRDAFVAVLGEVFEHSPWVASKAWEAGPFASVEALHAAMLDAVRFAPPPQRLAFLRGHPELAGREAQAGTMTGASTSEQSPLAGMAQAERERLQRLNTAYAERHGFPFIVAMRAHTRAQVFEALERRFDATPEAEMNEALRQIGLITRGRLDRLFGAATS